MRHVTHMNESCCTYAWVMSHVWMSHFAYMNESCRTYEWVMSHIWMSLVAYMNGSCHMSVEETTTSMFTTVIISIWSLLQSWSAYMAYDKTYVQGENMGGGRGTTRDGEEGGRATRLIHVHIRMCDMIHSHVWHDRFTYMGWLRLLGSIKL